MGYEEQIWDQDRNLANTKREEEGSLRSGAISVHLKAKRSW
jgi:hypothetical protein